MERTLAIIKPDAVAGRHTGAIISLAEQNGFKIDVMVKATLPEEVFADFYAVHKDKPFYQAMVKDMAAGPVVVMVLEKANAVADWRKLMGATNPAEAAEGTIRKQFGKSIGQNAVHGSDSVANAEAEIALMFGNDEVDLDAYEEECEEVEESCC